MIGRILEICSHLPQCKKFADVGCDHGYCSQYMLRHNLCEEAYLSDISEGSLAKARALLQSEGDKCKFICADGMKGLPPDCDCVLIAGMGGEEILRILTEGYLPEQFAFQPMKNAEKVRAFLLERGAEITHDYTFYSDGVYYDYIVGKRGKRSEYSDWEIKFGRDNLKQLPLAFVEELREQRQKYHGYLAREGMSEQSRADVLKRLEEVEVILNAIEDDL